MLNEDINFTGTVRVVSDSDDIPSEVMSFEEALDHSYSLGLDLVAVNMNIRPGIVKLIDFKSDLYQEFIENYIETGELGNFKF